MSRVREELADELDETYDKVERTLVEPNEEEKRNGWTAETLTAYHVQRRAGVELAVDIHSTQRRLGRRPKVQNSRYDPHRWLER